MDGDFFESSAFFTTFPLKKSLPKALVVSSWPWLGRELLLCGQSRKGVEGLVLFVLLAF
jgi:hypothetical protein